MRIFIPILTFGSDTNYYPNQNQKPMKKLLTLFVVLVTTTLISFSQTIHVEGVITVASGEELFGATVVEKGTNNGTLSRVDGTFGIDCNPNATLIVSYVGYSPTELKVNGQYTVMVFLEENALNMNGVDVIATRNVNRSLLETPVPVDVIPIDKITNTMGQLDLNQLLQYAAPSFNSNRQSGADGADHIDPATLRGLGPDQTLVLINGKRMHQSSLVNLYGTRGRGNSGTDLNTIPANAIERIEILRDGASAQYGSDAIAGVINIVLKKNVNMFQGNVALGTTSAGDGEQVEIGGNTGFSIGDDGYANVTLNYLNRGRTLRTPTDVGNGVYRNQFGDAAQENFSAYYNSGIGLGNGAEFYAYGGINHRNTDAFAWSRTPDSERNVIEIYPDGFDPHITSQIDDATSALGVRGMIGGWNVDFGNISGMNRFHFYVDGSLNASLEEASPTHFDAGGFQLSQNSTNLNFSRFWEEPLHGINLAFGAETRVENYQIFAGEEASWMTYGPTIFSSDSTFDSTGVFTGMDTTYRPGGSQGFPGFRPANEVDAFRTNLGFYADAEFDLTSNWMVELALRFENYSDFGNTLNWKIASRYEFSQKFAVRGSVSTGFRAPSLPQIYFNSVFTDFVAGVPTDKFLVQSNSNVTDALGIDPLRQEESMNASFGFTANPVRGLTVTVDGYYVDITDRIVLTGAFDASDTIIDDYLAPLNVASAQFFTNALGTTTMGVDVIIAYSHWFNDDNHLVATFAANFNNMELGDIQTSDILAGYEGVYFGTREQKFLLASAPPSKINLTLEYTMKKFSAMVRVVQFGEVVLEGWAPDGPNYDILDDTYAPAMTIDLTLGYQVFENFRLVVGGANITDAYPTAQDAADTESGGDWDAVQMGYMGSFWFTKGIVKF